MNLRGIASLLTFAICAALARPVVGQPLPILRPLPAPVPGELDVVLLPVAIADKFDLPAANASPIGIQVFEDGVEQGLVYLARAIPDSLVVFVRRDWMECGANDNEMNIRRPGCSYPPVLNFPPGAEELLKIEALRKLLGQGAELNPLLNDTAQPMLVGVDACQSVRLKRRSGFLYEYNKLVIPQRADLLSAGFSQPGLVRFAVVMPFPRLRGPHPLAQYVVAYRPLNARMDGTKRTVRVVLTFADPQARFRVKTSKSYRMPG